MKTLIKVAFVVALLGVGAIGWMAWRNKEVRHEAGRVAKGKVNQQLVETAERLADTLGRVKKTTATNQETKGK